MADVKDTKVLPDEAPDVREPKEYEDELEIFDWSVEIAKNRVFFILHTNSSDDTWFLSAVEYDGDEIKHRDRLFETGRKAIRGHRLRPGETAKPLEEGFKGPFLTPTLVKSSKTIKIESIDKEDLSYISFGEGLGEFSNLQNYVPNLCMYFLRWISFKGWLSPKSKKIISKQRDLGLSLIFSKLLVQYYEEMKADRDEVEEDDNDEESIDEEDGDNMVRQLEKALERMFDREREHFSEYEPLAVFFAMTVGVLVPYTIPETGDFPDEPEQINFVRQTKNYKDLYMTLLNDYKQLYYFSKVGMNEAEKAFKTGHTDQK